MAMLAVVLLAALWYVSGVASFVYWWTKDHDFTTLELPFVAFASVVGPFLFLVGWTVHGEFWSKNHILVKRR